MGASNDDIRLSLDNSLLYTVKPTDRYGEVYFAEPYSNVSVEGVDTEYFKYVWCDNQVLLLSTYSEDVMNSALDDLGVPKTELKFTKEVKERASNWYETYFDEDAHAGA